MLQHGTVIPESREIGYAALSVVKFREEVT